MHNLTYLCVLIVFHTGTAVLHASDKQNNSMPVSNESQRTLPMRSSAVFRFYAERSTLLEQAFTTDVVRKCADEDTYNTVKKLFYEAYDNHLKFVDDARTAREESAKATKKPDTH